MTLPAGAPPALTQVAQRFVETSRGVVAFQLHRVFDVHGGFSKRHDDLVLNGIYENGQLMRVRVVSYAINGKPASASDVADVQQSWNNPKPGDPFAPPFDPQNFDGYRYQPGGASTIDFTSSVANPGHGKGSFSYNSQNDVVSVTYQPNVLPPHATSGTITDVRAEVLPGYWAVTQETQQYKGKYGLFSAAGTIQVSFSAFKRFPDVDSAVRSL